MAVTVAGYADLSRVTINQERRLHESERDLFQSWVVHLGDGFRMPAGSDRSTRGEGGVQKLPRKQPGEVGWQLPSMGDLMRQWLGRGFRGTWRRIDDRNGEFVVAPGHAYPLVRAGKRTDRGVRNQSDAFV